MMGQETAQAAQPTPSRAPASRNAPDHAPDASLTDREERFCMEYVQGSSRGNATKSALAAGYGGGTNAKSAGVTASKLLARAKIASRVRELQESIAARAGDSLQGHLARLDELVDQARDLKQLTAAVRAEELRGKALGFYVERIQVSADIGDSDLLAAVAKIMPDQAQLVAALLVRSRGERDPEIIEGTAEAQKTATDGA